MALLSVQANGDEVVIRASQTDGRSCTNGVSLATPKVSSLRMPARWRNGILASTAYGKTLSFPAFTNDPGGVDSLERGLSVMTRSQASVPDERGVCRASRTRT